LESGKVWKKFGNFPAWKSLEKNFVCSVNMEKENKSFYRLEDLTHIFVMVLVLFKVDIMSLIVNRVKYYSACI